LQEIVQVDRDRRKSGEVMLEGVDAFEADEDPAFSDFEDSASADDADHDAQKLQLVRRELFEIRDLLMPAH